MRIDSELGGRLDHQLESEPAAQDPTFVDCSPAEERRPALSTLGLTIVGKRMATIMVLAVMPVALTFGLLSAGSGKGPFLYDFRGGMYGAGQVIVAGHNPYQADRVARDAAAERAGGKPSLVLAFPIYPAPALLAAVPLSLLPYQLAGVLFTLASIGALILALRLLGVRDWRCFGAAFLSYPVLHGLTLGAMTPLLVLGAAVAWRWRAGLWAPASAVAAVVAAKLFLCPLTFWMLVTRRWRTLALTMFIGATGMFAAWAVIGFAGLERYPQMLRDLASLLQGAGTSLVAGLLAVGFTSAIAKATAIVATVALLAAAWFLARQPDGDRRAFGLVVMAALTASPIVWAHYLALAFIPIALISPKFSPIWLTPLLGWLAPVELTQGDLRQILPYLAIEVTVIGLLLKPRSLSPSPVGILKPLGVTVNGASFSGSVVPRPASSE